MGRRRAHPFLTSESEINPTTITTVKNLLESIRNILLLVVGLTTAALTAVAHGDEFKPAFVDSLTPAYLDVAYCLMAFGGKGGDWL